MNLGNNSMAALVAQGCSEIRWLAKKVFIDFVIVTDHIIVRLLIFFM